MHPKSDFDRNKVQFVPFVLVPSSFPRKEFDKSRRIQTTLNALMNQVAHDDEFLTEHLKGYLNISYIGIFFRFFIIFMVFSIWYRICNGVWNLSKIVRSIRIL